MNIAYELEQGRAQYHEEVAMMRIVCQDTVRAAEKLGLQTEELKHEATALALQQHKVATISESLEQREARYKETGMFFFVKPDRLHMLTVLGAAQFSQFLTKRNI